MAHKTYPHITGVMGDGGETPGVLAITVALDAGDLFPENCRIVVGSPQTSKALPGTLPDLGGFAMGIEGAERVIATLQQAVSDVRAATGRQLFREVWPQPLGGFQRIGRIDSVGRRSLWLKEEPEAFELRAGRDGADAHVRIASDNPQFRELEDVVSTARFAAEWEDSRGFGLCPMGIEEHGYETSEITVTDDPGQQSTVFYLRDAGRDQRFRVIVRHHRHFAVQVARAGEPLVRLGVPTFYWDAVTKLATGVTPDYVMAKLLARLAGSVIALRDSAYNVHVINLGDVP